MTAVTPAVPWDVVEQLHARLGHLAPGSPEADATEAAISLALSPLRKPGGGSTLLYDVLRNARFTRKRSREREAKAYAEYVKAHSRRTAIANEPGIQEVARETPAHQVVARAAQARIASRAQGISGHHARCLQGMWAGESIAETAQACAVSPTTVDRMRSDIRDLARPILCEGM